MIHQESKDISLIKYVSQQDHKDTIDSILFDKCLLNKEYGNESVVISEPEQNEEQLILENVEDVEADVVMEHEAGIIGDEMERKEFKTKEEEEEEEEDLSELETDEILDKNHYWIGYHIQPQ